MAPPASIPNVWFVAYAIGMNSGWSSVPDDLQVLRRTEERAGHKWRRCVGVEPESGQPVEEGVEEQGAFDPGQMHTEAHMGAVAETDVRLAIPEDVEAL